MALNRVITLDLEIFDFASVVEDSVRLAEKVVWKELY
jgi:hypothetical protein